MKRHSVLRLFLLAAAGLAWAANARAQSKEPEPVAGRILNVQCVAKLMKKGTTNEVPLLYPRDVDLGLTAGDQVRCAAPGTSGFLEVLVSKGIQRVTVSKVGMGFPIPPLPSFPKDAKQDDLIAKQLSDYGVSGATRGNAADSRILWPTENGVVLPQHFVIRWKPVSGKVSVSIMSDTKDAAIWGPTEVAGSAGSLQSDEIASALVAYKKKSPNPRLVVTVTFGDPSDWEESHFALLGARQEQELDAQLGFWAKQPNELAVHLGRGYSFLSHGLFAEAAEEYEAALNAASESPYLLARAIAADRLAGRLSRATELQGRLASQSKAAASQY